jgi:membrane-associated HD superfamily phosphohydrolase
MDPEVTAQVIIRHVPDGLEMARKYHLPRRLFDFIDEHHGTLVTRYQHSRAVQIAGGDQTKVDESHFRYPGPKPSSKETAILMFADGVEAKARAEHPETDDEMRALIHSVIERCQKDGQLEETPLTQKDLANIADSFLVTLRVTFHPRLEYPQEQQPSQVTTLREVKTKPVTETEKKP